MVDHCDFLITLHRKKKFVSVNCEDLTIEDYTHMMIAMISGMDI